MFVAHCSETVGKRIGILSAGTEDCYPSASFESEKRHPDRQGIASIFGMIRLTAEKRASVRLSYIEVLGSRCFCMWEFVDVC